MSSSLPRRDFLQAALVGAVAAPAVSSGFAVAADAAGPTTKSGRLIKKAVKFDMIGAGKTIEEKFNLVKSLDFQGVEFNSPSGINKEEAVAAQEKTGIKIHGVIDSIHWDQRLSHPDEKVRANGLAGLRTAMKDAKTFGADTVLLVPGAVRNKETENFEQCWSRSQAEIRKALPEARELGVKIAIEVVWNDFLTTPEQLVKYVDDFKEELGTDKKPIVGAYFDCSNMLKYGVPAATWIRRLGPRMLKVDFKGYNNDTKKWVPIGEGTEDWPEVLKAFDEVGYFGWLTAEVGGGGEKVLRDISQRMDKLLGRTA